MIIKKIIGLISTVRGFMNRIKQDHVGAYAAQSAYFIILSFIPFILCLMAAVKYTSLSKDMVEKVIMEICPENLENFISGIINEVYNKSTAVVPLSALAALWSAGKGLQAVNNGLNTIYHVKETRNWLFTRLRSMLFTLGLVISLILSLVLLVFGNTLQGFLRRWLPLIGDLIARIMGARTFLVFGVLVLVFLCLFKFLPNRKATLKSQLPGAMVTSLAWMVFSYGYSIYFTYVPSFSNMYGSLTTIVLVMLWLYFCMNIVLCGAEINAYFEKPFQQAHAIARDLFDKEDENSEILHKDMDKYFEEEAKKKKRKKNRKSS